MNICRIFQKTLTVMSPALASTTLVTRAFSALRSQTVVQPIVSRILQFTLPALQSAGLKHVASPKRRCRHCYIVIEDERKWIFCDKFPRHKQVAKLPVRLARSQMTLTHATQGGSRRNNRNPRGHMHMLTQDGFRNDY